MSRPLVQVENLGKRYTIRHQATKANYRRFSEDLAAAITKPFRGGDDQEPDEKRAKNEDFWAVRDISFELERGEVLGVIGRNGAGKSTLLKIMSRITEPTEGRVRLRGRVASLLEVGTGFHPELTGRENIFLNGAILGMTRAEIRKNFDEIVAFSEVERFLDTPVKRYSSGMYVRLAFSVAAHLEPEILIVDEVLAVGDSAFQQKCLGKMQGIAQTDGRTVLFVSHNMASIRQLCPRVCLLRGGRIAAIGSAVDTISQYLSEAPVSRKVNIADWADRNTTGEGRILEIELQPDDQADAAIVNMGSTLRMIIRAELREPVTDPVFGVIIHDQLGNPLLDLRTAHVNLRLGRVHGPIALSVEVKDLGLYPGRYFLSPWIADNAIKRDIDFPKLCAAFDVRPMQSDVDLQLAKEWGRYFVPSGWALL